MMDAEHEDSEDAAVIYSLHLHCIYSFNDENSNFIVLYIEYN